MIRLMNSTTSRCVLLIVSVTVAIYWQTALFDFVEIDDPVYVTSNPLVLSGLNSRSLGWSFSTFHCEHYHPLVWLSLILDSQLYGSWSGGFHLTNLALHIANSVLLFLVWRRMTGAVGKSLLLALLFATHPVHVESVAWVTERKDCLSTFFAFLTTLSYASSANSESQIDRWRTLLLFGLCLLSKSMFVVLPLIFCLLDIWPLGRQGRFIPVIRQNSSKRLLVNQASDLLKQFLRNKWELFAASFLFSAIAYTAQIPNHSGSAVLSLPLSLRVPNAIVSYVCYVASTFWPLGLAVHYPFRTEILTFGNVVLSALFLVCVTGACVFYHKRAPHLVVGWGMFVLGLLPVIGLVRISDYRMADRYLYTPMVGLLVTVIWGYHNLETVFGQRRLNRLGPLLGTLSVMIAAGMAYGQIATWRNSETLFTHAAAVTAKNDLVHAGLGVHWLKQGRSVDAMAEFKRCLAINPRRYDIRLALAGEYLKAGNTPAGLQEFETIGVMESDRPWLQSQVITLLLQHAEKRVACMNSKEASLVIDKITTAIGHLPNPEPAMLSSHANLSGLLCRNEQQWDQAIGHFQRALACDCQNASARANLAACQMDAGKAKASAGDLTVAIAHFQEAVKHDPQSSRARYNLGLACAKQGALSEAVTEFRAALRIEPNFNEAHLGLAQVLAFQGLNAEAKIHFAAAAKMARQDASSDSRSTK